MKQTIDALRESLRGKLAEGVFDSKRNSNAQRRIEMAKKKVGSVKRLEGIVHHDMNKEHGWTKKGKTAKGMNRKRTAGK